MILRNAAGLIGLAILVAGCASTGSPSPAPSRFQSLAAERGRRIAEVRCAGCHAIAALNESPRTGAPAFGQVRLRYNALSWPRVMSEVSAGRHGEMPPIALADSEVEDLRAYMETLR